MLEPATPHSRAIRTMLAAGAMAALGCEARAAGFQLREGDPDWLANAFAGTAAKAYDAGTAWNNPAGMVLIDGAEIDSAVNYFDPGIRFSGVNRAAGGGTGGDAGPPAVTAGSEAVWRVTPDVALGFASEAPFGLRTAYAPGWTGRYQALVSSLFDLQVALAAAYRVTPELSLGGGPVLTYFHARLTQAINTQAFAPGLGDSIVDIHGDDIAAGYHLGALYQITPALRVGLDYHSRIGTNITGQQRVAIPGALLRGSPFVAAVLQGLNQDAMAQVALPDYATLSAYDAVCGEVAAMASVQWTDWSLIKTLTVQTPMRIEATPIGFRNTWMGALGLNWRPAAAPRLMLQTGVLYDQGANTDATRGPRLPDEDRIGTGVGLQFAVTPRIGLRVAYLHEFPGFGGDKVAYTNNFPGAGVLTGTYKNDADVVSAGVAVRF